MLYSLELEKFIAIKIQYITYFKKKRKETL